MAHRRRPPSADEAGFTLVEVIVSLLIISVIMAAAAASLITSARQSSVNEHRLQATSYLTQLHERLQATPWNRVAMYEAELDDLEAFFDADGEGAYQTLSSRFDFSGDPTFDGDPIATIPGPFDFGDCDEECSRLPFVPEAYRQGPVSPDADQRFDFEVFQIVTEHEEGTTDAPNVKRFTTVVRWELAGRQFEEIFDSERAATAAELREVAEPEVRLSLFSPRFVEVVYDAATDTWSNRLRHDVIVRFRDQMNLNSVELRYPTADGAFGTIVLQHDDVGFTADEVRTSWRGTIDPGDLANLPPPIPAAPRQIEMVVVGTRSDGEVMAQPLEGFILDEDAWDGLNPQGGGDTLTADAEFEVGVDALTAIEDVICQPVQFTARMTHSNAVNLSDLRATLYFPGLSSQSVTMGNRNHPSGNQVHFTFAFETGQVSPLLPPRESPSAHTTREERFYLIADYVDDDDYVHESLIFESSVIDVERFGFGYPCGGG